MKQYWHFRKVSPGWWLFFHLFVVLTLYCIGYEIVEGWAASNGSLIWFCGSLMLLCLCKIYSMCVKQSWFEHCPYTRGEVMVWKVHANSFIKHVKKGLNLADLEKEAATVQPNRDHHTFSYIVLALIDAYESEVGKRWVTPEMRAYRRDNIIAMHCVRYA